MSERTRALVQLARALGDASNVGNLLGAAWHKADDEQVALEFVRQAGNAANALKHRIADVQASFARLACNEGEAPDDPGETS